MHGKRFQVFLTLYHGGVRTERLHRKRVGGVARDIDGQVKLGHKTSANRCARDVTYHRI